LLLLIAVDYVLFTDSILLIAVDCVLFIDSILLIAIDCVLDLLILLLLIFRFGYYSQYVFLIHALCKPVIKALFVFELISWVFIKNMSYVLVEICMSCYCYVLFLFRLDLDNMFLEVFVFILTKLDAIVMF
jgi:hypothetical protein